MLDSMTIGRFLGETRTKWWFLVKSLLLLEPLSLTCYMKICTKEWKMHDFLILDHISTFLYFPCSPCTDFPNITTALIIMHTRGYIKFYLFSGFGLWSTKFMYWYLWVCKQVTPIKCSLYQSYHDHGVFTVMKTLVKTSSLSNLDSGTQISYIM